MRWGQRSQGGRMRRQGEWLGWVQTGKRQRGEQHRGHLVKVPAAASVTWRDHETRGPRSDYKVKRLRHRIQMLKKNPQAQNTGTYTTRHHKSAAPAFPDCSVLWWVRNFPACTNELICLRGVLQPPEEDEVTATQPHPIPHRGITLAWNNLFCLWPPCLAFKNLSFPHSPDGMPPNSRLIQ